MLDINKLKDNFDHFDDNEFELLENKENSGKIKKQMVSENHTYYNQNPFIFVDGQKKSNKLNLNNKKIKDLNLDQLNEVVDDISEDISRNTVKHQLIEELKESDKHIKNVFSNFDGDFKIQENLNGDNDYVVLYSLDRNLQEISVYEPNFTKEEERYLKEMYLDSPDDFSIPSDEDMALNEIITFFKEKIENKIEKGEYHQRKLDFIKNNINICAYYMLRHFNYYEMTPFLFVENIDEHTGKRKYFDDIAISTSKNNFKVAFEKNNFNYICNNYALFDDKYLLLELPEPRMNEKMRNVFVSINNGEKVEIDLDRIVNPKHYNDDDSKNWLIIEDSRFKCFDKINHIEDIKNVTIFYDYDNLKNQFIEYEVDLEKGRYIKNLKFFNNSEINKNMVNLISIRKTFLENITRYDLTVNKYRLSFEYQPAGGFDLSIRGKEKVTLHWTDLIRFGTLTPTLFAYISVLMEIGVNLAVCGQTASGKTTLLNIIINSQSNSKCAIVEDDVNELIVDGVVATQVMFNKEKNPEYVKSALRKNPTYLILGEVLSGHELKYVLNEGAGIGQPLLFTFHAENAKGMKNRLGPHLQKEQLDMIDVVIFTSQINYWDEKNNTLASRRVLTEVVEYPFRDEGKYSKNFIRFNRKTLQYESNLPKILIERLAQEGLEEENIKQFILDRIKIVENCYNEDRKNFFNDVKKHGNFIERYKPQITGDEK